MTARLATPRHAICGVVVGHRDSVMAPSTRHAPCTTAHAPDRRSLIERHRVRDSSYSLYSLLACCSISSVWWSRTWLPPSTGEGTHCPSEWSTQQRVAGSSAQAKVASSCAV